MSQSESSGSAASTRRRASSCRRLTEEPPRSPSSAYENLAFVSFGTVPQYTYPLPDPIDTVLEIEYQ